MSLAVIAVCATGWLFSEYQNHARAATPLLPVTFAHKTHTSVSCVVCHHDFIDHSGQGLCFDCHKTHPDVAALVEEQFHELCWGCHVTKQKSGEDHGPTRQCVSCHEADDDP